LNPPAGTTWAVVMVVPASEREARLSQVAAAPDAAIRLSIAANNIKNLL
jgi:hypothetical protein